MSRRVGSSSLSSYSAASMLYWKTGLIIFYFHGIICSSCCQMVGHSISLSGLLSPAASCSFARGGPATRGTWSPLRGILTVFCGSCWPHQDCPRRLHCRVWLGEGRSTVLVVDVGDALLESADLLLEKGLEVRFVLAEGDAG